MLPARLTCFHKKTIILFVEFREVFSAYGNMTVRNVLYIKDKHDQIKNLPLLGYNFILRVKKIMSWQSTTADMMSARYDKACDSYITGT